MSKAGQITLGIRSSEGRKRLQISSSVSGTSLKAQIKALLNTDEDFVVKRDQNGRPGEEVRFTRTSTLVSLKLKTGDVLYVTPKAGTRFITEDQEDNQNNGNMSTSGSSTSLNSIKSANNNSTLPLIQFEVGQGSHKCLMQFFVLVSCVHFRKTLWMLNCQSRTV